MSVRFHSVNDHPADIDASVARLEKTYRIRAELSHPPFPQPDSHKMQVTFAPGLCRT